MRIPFSPNVAPGSDPYAKATRLFRAEKTPAPRISAPGVDPEHVRAKVEWARARGHAVDLEIGCGVGWHPLRYAAENRDRLLFAVERTAEKFAKFRERIANHAERENLVAVHADAISWMVHVAPEVSFDRILLLYPNPNPKNAAARWVRMPFFGYLLGRLSPRGTIHFRTNSAGYADEVRELGVANWGLRIVESREITHQVGVDPATHFERKYLERGEVCTELVLARNETRAGE